jgi:hypothetical protein
MFDELDLKIDTATVTSVKEAALAPTLLPQCIRTILYVCTH